MLRRIRETVEELIDLWRMLGEVQRTLKQIDRDGDLW
jgi:hypothetical protein